MAGVFLFVILGISCSTYLVFLKSRTHHNYRYSHRPLVSRPQIRNYHRHHYNHSYYD